jgi:hypothetical protein
MPVVAIVAARPFSYNADCEPAHIHAVLAEWKMLVRIASLTVMEGDLPTAAVRNETSNPFEWTASAPAIFKKLA